MKTAQNRTFAVAVLLIASLGLGACGTESHQTIETIQVNVNSDYTGPKAPLTLGRFNNKSSYMNGVFASGDDAVGNKAKEILKAQLSKTNRFELLDRDNLEEMKTEAGYSGTEVKVQGARYLLTGSVTDFGRKETGSRTFFGLFGKSKNQIAYSKVTLNVVEVSSSRNVYSVDGAGEFEFSTMEVLGTGSRSKHDATLNGKVLNLAIVNAINDLVSAIESGDCKLH